MALIDDFVKLNGGKTFNDALSTMGKTILERKVSEQAIPLVQSYASMFLGRDEQGNLIPSDKANIRSPEDIASAASRTMLDLVQIPGAQFTDTFRTLSDNIRASAESQVKAFSEVSQGKLREAQAGREKSITSENIAQTSHLEKELTEADLKYFPDSIRSYLKQRKNKGEKITYREAFSISKIEEPYINLAMAQIRAGETDKQIKNNLFNFRKDYLYPALGAYSTYVSSDEQIDKNLLEGDLNKLVKSIADDVIKAQGRKPAYKSEEDLDVYNKVRDKVMSGFRNSGMVATTGALAAQVGTFPAGADPITGQVGPEAQRVWEERFGGDEFLQRLKGTQGQPKPSPEIQQVQALEDEYRNIYSQWVSNPRNTALTKRLAEIRKQLESAGAR